MYQLVWSKGALADLDRGSETQRLAAHRISSVESLRVARAFTEQTPAGTPWRLLDQESGETVLEGRAERPVYA